MVIKKFPFHSNHLYLRVFAQSRPLTIFWDFLFTVAIYGYDHCSAKTELNIKAMLIG